MSGETVSPVIHHIVTGYFNNFYSKFEKEFHRLNIFIFTSFSPVHRLTIPHPSPLPSPLLSIAASTSTRVKVFQLTAVVGLVLARVARVAPSPASFRVVHVLLMFLSISEDVNYTQYGL